MKTILLLISLTFFKAMVSNAQGVYGGVELGAGQVLKQTSILYARGHIGYGLQLRSIDLFTEFDGSYYIVNRLQGSLMIGSTVLNEHIILMGGISTIEKRVIGKLEVKGSIYPAASLRYQIKLVGKRFMTGERLAMDGYLKAHITYQTFTLGIGLTSFKIR